jgi:hypothetical protein
MAGFAKAYIAPIIISRNTREEIRLTLRHCHDVRLVDLRIYTLDEKKGKAAPTDRGAVIDLKLWPRFRRAVASLKPSNGAFPVWVQQMAPDAGSRSIFPSSTALEQNRQEQIYLERQDFQGITFILLKTSAISKRGRPGQTKRVITIGPILWCQFLKALNKMQEVLLDQGLLAGEVHGEQSRPEEMHA